VNGALQETLNSKIEGIFSRQTQMENRLLGIAALFSRADSVRKAYRIAYGGNLQDENDPRLAEAREMLRSFFSSLQERYKEIIGDRQFRVHFHLPPARSLAPPGSLRYLGRL